jgi:multicomponent Na+:H+ antiporter subunit F
MLIEPAVLSTSLGLLLLSLILSMYRLIMGPHINDRIVALDLIASIVMGFVLLFSISAREMVYFDLVIVISLVSFMGTIGISTYLRARK